MPEVSQESLNIIERLVRVETKLDTLNESKAQSHIEIIKDIADHETRLRQLERLMWKAIGASAGVSTLASITANYIIRMKLG